MGRVDGKVAFITGAGRGQGRSHAVRLAEEGADIVAIDICEDVEGVEIPCATEADLQETVRLVEATGRRVLARKADVRSAGEVAAVVDDALVTFGKIDVVVANAAVVAYKRFLDLSEELWLRTMDINLNGVFRTVKAVLPSMVERNEGGSIILISSGVAFRSGGAVVDYAAAKTALIGLARSLAQELSPHWIRVNTIHPGHILTPILDNEVYGKRLGEALGGRTFESRDERLEAMWELFKPRHMLPLGWLESIDISNAVLWLASDESRYVTAEELRVDAGFAGR
jgi:SDR family mycofactocin-dependent oxidoreductase